RAKSKAAPPAQPLRRFAPPPHEWGGAALRSRSATTDSGTDKESRSPFLAKSTGSPSGGCPIPAASGGTSPLRGEEPPPHELGGATLRSRSATTDSGTERESRSPFRAKFTVRSWAAPSPPQAAVLPHCVGKTS